MEIRSRREGEKNPPEEVSKNNEREWLDALNKDGRRLRGRRRGRRLGHPTVRERGKPAECNRQPVTETVTQDSVHRFPSQIGLFYLFSSTAGLPNIPSTNRSQIFAEKSKQKGRTRRAADCRHRSIDVQHPAELHQEFHATPYSISVSSLQATDVHSRLTKLVEHQRTYRLKRKAFRSCEFPSLISLPLIMLTPEDIAEEIRASFPGTEEIVVQYLAGYLLDDAGEDEDILQIARLILESVAGRNTKALEALMAKLADMLDQLLTARASQTSRGTGLTKLDRAMEIGKTAAMSSTIAMSQGVDLESINKGK